jgi:hypothetical protein
MLFFYLLQVSISIDTITSSQFIKDPDTLLSKDGNYAFGFLGPKILLIAMLEFGGSLNPQTFGWQTETNH